MARKELTESERAHERDTASGIFCSDLERTTGREIRSARALFISLHHLSLEEQLYRWQRERASLIFRKRKRERASLASLLVLVLRRPVLHPPRASRREGRRHLVLASHAGTNRSHLWQRRQRACVRGAELSRSTRPMCARAGVAGTARGATRAGRPLVARRRRRRRVPSRSGAIRSLMGKTGAW